MNKLKIPPIVFIEVRGVPKKIAKQMELLLLEYWEDILDFYQSKKSKLLK